MDDTASPEIVEVTTASALQALRPEWEALWRRTPGATPFQSPAWLVPWWQSFGRGRLLALALRESGRLVGMAPFYVLEEQGIRKLLPVGIGVSDRLDPLLEPSHATPVMAHLVRRRDRFDRVDLEDLEPGSPLMAAPAPPGWGDRRHACSPRPALSLPPEAAALARAVPRLAKQAYYRRRAARHGPIRLAWASAIDLADAVQALFELHAARWASRGELGLLIDPAVRRFHLAASAELMAAGLLRCRVLWIGDRMAAVLYGLADRACFHAYLAGYDPRLAHPGLGALMIGDAIEAARAEGLRTFDFLRGAEAYKYAWGAIDRPAVGRRLTPPA